MPIFTRVKTADSLCQKQQVANIYFQFCSSSFVSEFWLSIYAMCKYYRECCSKRTTLCVYNKHTRTTGLQTDVKYNL